MHQVIQKSTHHFLPLKLPTRGNLMYRQEISEMFFVYGHLRLYGLHSVVYFSSSHWIGNRCKVLFVPFVCYIFIRTYMDLHVDSLIEYSRVSWLLPWMHGYMNSLLFLWISLGSNYGWLEVVFNVLFRKKIRDWCRKIENAVIPYMAYY